MASVLKRKRNTIHYISCKNSDLDKVEKDVKAIVRLHFGLKNEKQGGTFINNISKNEEASFFLRANFKYISIRRNERF